MPPAPAPIRAASPRAEPIPFYLWPLAVIDWTIGKPFSAFGAPGRWVGSGGGKMLVGWVGLLLIAAAAVWGVVDYMGWSW
jgi:hypothetical protein